MTNPMNTTLLGNYNSAFLDAYNNYDSLTPTQRATARAEVAAYYTYVQSFGSGFEYGQAAYEVATNQGPFGGFANEQLKNIIRETFPGYTVAQQEALRDKTMFALAATDSGVRTSDDDGIISTANISTYHYTVLQGLGLPKEAWGGAALQEFGYDGSWMDLYKGTLTGHTCR